METDYIDDPEMPGAVLGPKTVPRRILQLIDMFGEEAFRKVHKENPAQVCGIEIVVCAIAHIHSQLHDRVSPGRHRCRFRTHKAHSGGCDCCDHTRPSA
ncbi:MAG: hypothetical protein C5S49_04440 [Candidatus Methanogaster sp.]|nr:MAG: hypothetical protein C5S49_04440 [ANME-2 cluster archaeon]